MSTANLATTTTQEDDLIEVAFVATSNALGDAIIALKRLEATTFDHVALDDLILKRRRLEDLDAANQRAFLAYCDQQIGMHPPSPEEVKAIVQIAGELALLTQKKATAAAILTLANKANARFKEVRGGA